jgi:hypothetical protein
MVPRHWLTKHQLCANTHYIRRTRTRFPAGTPLHDAGRRAAGSPTRRAQPPARVSTFRHKPPSNPRRAGASASTRACTAPPARSSPSGWPRSDSGCARCPRYARHSTAVVRATAGNATARSASSSILQALEQGRPAIAQIAVQPSTHKAKGTSRSRSAARPASTTCPRPAARAPNSPSSRDLPIPGCGRSASAVAACRLTVAMREHRRHCPRVAGMRRAVPLVGVDCGREVAAGRAVTFDSGAADSLCVRESGVSTTSRLPVLRGLAPPPAPGRYPVRRARSGRCATARCCRLLRSAASIALP